MTGVGSKLIFENERVKVWEFTLAPGETIATSNGRVQSSIAPPWNRKMARRLCQT